MLGDDLSLQIGDSPALRLTPRVGFELAEALLRQSTETAMREAARETKAVLPRLRRKVA